MSGKKCILMVLSALIILISAAGNVSAAQFSIQMGDGTSTVIDGDTFEFSVTADAGNETVGVYLDDVLVGSWSDYKFTNISGNHKLRAEFLGLPQLSGSEKISGGSIGTFSVSSAGSEYVEIAFGDGSEKTRYNATDGKIVVTHKYSADGEYNITARAMTANKSVGSSVTMDVSVSSMGLPSAPVSNSTVINTSNANVTSIAGFSVNESDTSGTPMITVEDCSVLPSGYGTLPETKGVLAVLNIVPVNVASDLSNLSVFTVRVNKSIVKILCPDGATVNHNKFVVYRNTIVGGSYVQVPLKTIPNSSASTRDCYGYDVETTGYSYFTFAVIPESSGIAPPDEEVTPGQNPNKILPLPTRTQTPIYYTTVKVSPGSFTYTTTVDKKVYTVDNMTVLGVLCASGRSIETKEWPGGIYVYSINGLAQDENLNGWLYQVNGETPSVMANNYQVRDGDRIVWYYSESMDSAPEKSKSAFGLEVKEVQVTPTPTATPAPLAELTPAKTSNVSITLPDGVSISSRGKTSTLKIDTSKTNKQGNVNVKGWDSVIITQPGLQITFDVTDMDKIDSGTIQSPSMTITAEIEKISIKTLPAESKVNPLGTVI